jgi:hypothetical protein
MAGCGSTRSTDSHALSAHGNCRAAPSRRHLLGTCAGGGNRRLGSEPAEIEFRPVEESDFPTLTAWFAEPHVRRFYQKTPVTLEQVALEYEPFVRGEEPTIWHLAFP